MVSARSLQPQDRISHYRIVGPLGAGGMGEVYLAEDQTLERSVALKILPPELVRSEERVRRFVREAKSASSLNHPNIVTIYEIGHDEIRGAEGGSAEPGSASVHFISMELVSGETLSTKIHQSKTDLRTLLGYLAQAAEGLAKAHAAGIVHRDLKPGNIMISKDGYAKVLDFGLAKLTEKDTADADPAGATMAEDGTGVGAVLGTVGYMSPEQVRGGVVDHRSDIFSFGCILYEAATRTKPFVADSSVETMHRILHDKPVPVEERNKAVPAELRRLIRRCLAKSPDQRFQSAKDLAIELREIVDEYETLSPSGTSGSGSSAMAAPAIIGRKGIPAPMLVAGAVIVGALIVAGALFLGRGGGGNGRSTASPLRISTVTNRGLISGAALSPDGRTLAYSLVLGSNRSIRVRQVATGGDVEVLPPPQSIPPNNLVFTPDGNYLFYSSADPDRDGYTAVFEIPTLGGTPRKRVYDVDSRVSFSPDGKRICFRRGVPHKKQDHLVILDLGTQKERVLASVTLPILFGQPAWSPDGKRIAILEVRGGEVRAASVATYRVEDGTREALGKEAWFDATDLSWMPDGRSLVISAFDESSITANQLWFLTYPAGKVERLTHDTSFYSAATASSDGSAIAAVRVREEKNLWVARAAGPRSVTQITFGSDEEGNVRDFDPGPDSTVYHMTYRDGALQIFAIGMNGTGERSVTADARLTLNPWYRPGAGLVFERVDEGFGIHIWRADPNGENPRQLTTGKGERIVDVSPDGSRVLFSRDDVPDVVWSVSTNGGDPVRLATSSNPSAKFSPDGSRIFHVLIQEVQGQGEFLPQIIPAGGGTGTILPSLPKRIFEPAWTPDGRGLTFLTSLGDFSNLQVMPLDGSPRALTHFTEGRMTAHRWSPDGKHIVVERKIGETGTDNLWVVDANGGNPVAITDFESGSIGEIRWSADGSRVIFTYGSTTQNVVLLRGFRPEKS
jgi:eukaryotic-like serine/threonine-protein kinase